MHKHKGTLFNILFMIYVLFFQNHLAGRFDLVMTEKQPWLGMAIALFIISMLEGAYLPYKIRNAFFRSRRTLTGNEAAIWFMLPIIFRTVIGLAIAVMVFSLAVPDIRHKTLLSPVAAVMVIVLVIKELVTLFRAMMLLVMNTAKPCPRSYEWIGDGLILAYSCIAFTLITRPGFFFTAKQSTSMTMMPLVVFTFFAFLLSLRLGFYVEEYLAALNLRQKLAIWISLLIAAMTAAGVFIF